MLDREELEEAKADLLDVLDDSKGLTTQEIVEELSMLGWHSLGTRGVIRLLSALSDQVHGDAGEPTRWHTGAPAEQPAPSPAREVAAESAKAAPPPRPAARAVPAAPSPPGSRGQTPPEQRRAADPGRLALWDRALADVIYSTDRSGLPTYLDLEDDVLVAAASRAGLGSVTPATAEKDLVDAVAARFRLDGGGKTFFGYFSDRLSIWNTARRLGTVPSDEPPPVVALLAVFARAADRMGADSAFSAQAYYPRLTSLLGLNDEAAQRLRAAFQMRSEQYWAALNLWLDGLDGARGVATASSVGHRYVGIPMSQALIRDADRSRLNEFLSDAELQGGMRLSPEDLMGDLERWFAAGRAPTGLKRLWASKDGRFLVAEAAAQALQHWDGSGRAADRAVRGSRPRLTVRFGRVGLGPRRSFLSFVVPGEVDAAGPWHVESAPGRPVIDLEPVNASVLAPSPATMLADRDIAEVVRGTLILAKNERRTERRPEPVVALVLTEELGMFVETDNVRLGEQHIVIVNESVGARGGAPWDASAALEEACAPGWSRLDAGWLPMGWAAYQGVIPLRAHTQRHESLSCLKPVQSSALTVSGGLRLPGHAQRWSALVPLVVRAVSPEASAELTAVRVDVDESEELGRWPFAGELEISTSSMKLDAGVYRLTVNSPDGAPRRNMQLALCTSNEPRQPAAPPAPSPVSLPPEICATRRTDASDLTLMPETLDEWQRLPVPPAQRWERIRLAPTRQRPIAAVDASSCAVTLAHRTELVQVSKVWDKGTCSSCGRVKFYRRRLPRDPKPTTETPGAAPRDRGANVLGASADAPAVTGAEVVDALVWMGGGSAGEAENLIRQASDSALAVDSVLRALEAVGHIDLLRGYDSGAVIGWRMSERQLVGLCDGSWLAVGRWDADSIYRLHEGADGRGAHFANDDSDWLPRRSVHGLDPVDADALAAECGAVGVPDAARRVLASLSPLLEMVSSLPRCSVAGLTDVEMFSPRAASWIPSHGIAAPGAFRTTGFSRHNFFVSQGDLASSSAVRGSVYLVKHAGAAAQGSTLLSYDAPHRVMSVPLGAELPGMYGRALALCAGRPPSTAEGAALHMYLDVPADVAAKIAQLMRSES